MPTYEYKCNVCKKSEEFFLTVKQSEKQIKCKHCKSYMVKLISGGCGVIYKSSGFYKTDNRK